MMNKHSHYLFAFFLFAQFVLHAQTFPNPITLTTGQGAQGTFDPVWTVSEFWYNTPPGPMGLNYSPALINANCAPGAWVDPASLPPPTNNGNWITGPDADCANNFGEGYRYFRLTLNLPPDCNGYSVTVAGNYILSFDGYVDNAISDVYINGTPQGISGGGYAAGSQLTFTLNGPWLVGTNYVDVMIYNTPNNGNANPYGLLLVANTTTPIDTDGDGISNIDDLCPCTPGTNAVGCPDPSNQNACDLNAIRSAFIAANCIEMNSCVGLCSMYFLNPQSLSGSAAQAFAQNLGANLVSVQSQAENDCIMSSLNDMGQSGVIWIGFNDEAVEGTFVWYDQSPVVYTNWAAGEPNNAGGAEDCVQIYADGSWNDLSGTTANAQSIIEVNLCPVLDAGPDVTICNGQTANLAVVSTLFGSPAYTYSWNNGVQGAANPVSPAASTDFTATSVDRYSCTTTDLVHVTVNPLPPVNAGTDQDACAGDGIILSASGAVSYAWNNGITNGVSFVPASTQTYTVTGTDANGCANTDQVLVTVHSLPAVSAGADQVVCPGSAVTLSGSGAAAYTWDQNVTNGVPFSPAATATYTVTGTDANGCSNTDQSTVTVDQLPDASFTTGNVSGCLPMGITFTPTGTATYQWTFGDGTTANGTGTMAHNYGSAGCYTVTLTATSPTGCTAQQTQVDAVCIPPDPEAAFSGPNEQDMFNTELSFLNASLHADTYLWHFGDGSSSTTVSPSHTYEMGVPGTYSVVLIAYNANGCADTARSEIVIREEVVYYIPNTFTPDGDEFNQSFKPVFTSGYDPYDYNLKIFNRWGEVIFESNNADIGWDGATANGTVPEGTYTWKIEFSEKETSKRHSIAGHVFLVR